MFAIIKSLFLPSSFIAIFIIVGFILYILKKKPIGKLLIVIGVFFYYIFSITPTADLLMGFLEGEYDYLPIDKVMEADKAVLLLGGREADSLRGSEVLRISYIKDHNIKIIISGTNPLDPKRKDLSTIESFLVNRGVPEDNLIIEDKSKNTWENVRNVKGKVGEEPFFLITSAYHMNRSLREFEKLGLNPVPAPTDFKRRGRPYGLTDFIPGARNLQRTDLAFHEFLGRVYYDIVFNMPFIEERF